MSDRAARRFWRLMMPCAAGLLFGGGCTETIRTALFQSAFEFITGQVNPSVLNLIPVDDIIGGLLGPGLRL